jgi:hypothetical protein
MKEARPHLSNMTPEMSTENVGEILPGAWSVSGDRGRKTRAAYRQPAEFTPGPNGEIGVGAIESMIMPWDEDA